MARLALLLMLLAAVGDARGEDEGAEFFEKEVRPVLVERCGECHGTVAKPKGGLRLTSRAEVLAGGDSGPAAVAGKPDESLLIAAIRYVDEPRMPPRVQLKDREIEALTRWVARGLPWPEEARPQSVAAPSGPASPISEEQRRFWAFQPVADPAPPAVRDRSWPQSAIDLFILADLEAKGLKPAPACDRRSLIRRATVDLTGLPPTPEEVERFVADPAPDAFARVVDRLLASPRYGERWGRHWLDVVRYTDSFDARGTGGEMDCADAWRYRDWVVSAFNQDLPYDQFLTQQIAGDLLPASPPDAVIATGMLALGNWGGGDADKEKLLTDIADDQVDVVSRAFLGLTIACARCHDHKFDPISQKDYYGLAGIFFSTHILPNVGPKTNGPPMLRIPLDTPAQRAARERHTRTVADLERRLQQTLDEPRLRGELDALKKNLPPPPAFANGAEEGGVPGSPHAGTHDVRVHIRGSYARLGDLVPRHFPVVLAGESQPAITSGSGRLELARWLCRPDHPLTARVLVNRVWQHHFGAGIVRTPSNFGKLGERPTHPELLDHLASRFVRDGWSLKRLHRAIMLSSTYQQSTEADSETRKADPDNRLFGRMDRRRLEAEAIRDHLLAVSGRLDDTAGGPATRDFNSPRRTLYLMTVRSDRSGFGPLFDVADPTAMVDRRAVSTVAPQALFLLNNAFVLDQAEALARRAVGERPDDRARIDRLYQRLYARPPRDEERRIGLDSVASADGRRERLAAWTAYCQVLLCANEMIYID